MFELLFNFLPLIFEVSTPAVQPKLNVWGIKYFYPYNIFLLIVKSICLILIQPLTLAIG